MADEYRPTSYIEAMREVDRLNYELGVQQRTIQRVLNKLDDANKKLAKARERLTEQERSRKLTRC